MHNIDWTDRKALKFKFNGQIAEDKKVPNKTCNFSKLE